MIFLYRILTFFLFPIFVIITYLRRFADKEDKIRFKEKISINESFFPKNKKVVWIHAASIGETTTTNTGGGGAHTHTVSGTTGSEGSSATDKNLPPYYALCYIMKT